MFDRPLDHMTVVYAAHLSRRDLETYIGSRARVAEVFNRKRPLSLDMIRRLHGGLGISAEVLIQQYPVAPPAE